MGCCSATAPVTPIVSPPKGFRLGCSFCSFTNGCAARSPIAASTTAPTPITSRPASSKPPTTTPTTPFNRSSICWPPDLSLPIVRLFFSAILRARILHRPLRAGDDLEDAFAWKEERTLSQALTLQYDKVIFILEPSEQAKAAIGKRVTVFDYPDGRLSVRHKGIELAYRTFDKIRQIDQGAIVDNK